MDKTYDIVVYGATGFTGRLVAEHLVATAQMAGRPPVRWAMAGRSLDRLREVRQLIGAAPDLPLIAADAADPAALRALVTQTRAVITTVGPYQRYGEALVTACAEAGTDYLDLCGEPNFMARMIPRLDGPARASGARILFSCGFDSIPFDLGVVYLQTEGLRRFGVPFQHVGGRVRKVKGGWSGGTMASGFATMDAMAGDPSLRVMLADPFALTPGFAGPPQPEGDSAAYDELAGAWSGPFLMAAINTKNVHRTHALLGHPWGRDFTYDERMLCGEGAKGEARARKLARTTRLQNVLLSVGWARTLIRKYALPQPGEGPSREERESGSYEVLFTGRTADGRTAKAVVTGDRDPGYGSTARMIVESARCLLEGGRLLDGGPVPGGVWTPGAALGMALVQQLSAHAGLTFTMEPTGEPAGG